MIVWSWSWGPFLSTLACVFVMETLDNTQMIQIYFSAQYGRQWLLALASWTAFVFTGVIGSSFSALRSLSENATRSIELVFALLVLVLGVVTLSHSPIVLAAWAKMAAFLQRHVADRFLGAIGEKPQDASPKEEEEDEEAAAAAAEKEKETGEQEIRAEEDEEEEEDPHSTAEDITSIELAETRVDIVEVSQRHRRQKKQQQEKQQQPQQLLDDEQPKKIRRNIAWWRLFLLVFVTVFALELPDKTMIMVATLAQSSDYPIAIFVGYACAMIAQSLIALIVGKGIGDAAEKYGERIEIIVGCILFLTGTAKIFLMVFVGDFTIDFFGVSPPPASGNSSSFSH